MSAFMLDREHIRAMLEVGIRHTIRHGGLSWYHGPTKVRRVLDYTTADETGGMLLAQNARSVGYRYAEDVPVEEYVHATPRYEWTATDALKMVACYEYQSCEDPGWTDSQARAFCHYLRDALIAALPGYSDAPWAVTPETVPARVVRAKEAKAAALAAMRNA